jgi:hypothetical protein
MVLLRQVGDRIWMSHARLALYYIGYTGVALVGIERGSSCVSSS